MSEPLYYWKLFVMPNLDQTTERTCPQAPRKQRRNRPEEQPRVNPINWNQHVWIDERPQRPQE
jgi:hypothetical protein